MKKSFSPVIAGVLLALAFVAAPAARAADVGPKVSVDFKSATAQDVANFLAVKAGVNIVVEKGVVGQINLRVADVNWLDILTLAVKQVGCTVEKAPDGIYHVVTPHFSFTTKSEGVSLKQVVSLLAQQSGQNIVVAPNVDAVVHFSLQDVPWQVALDTVVKTAGPFTVVRDEAGVFSVVKADSLTEQKETKVFGLKYIEAPSQYKPKITTEFAERTDSGSSGGGGGAGGTMDQMLKDNFTLYKAVSNIVTGKGSVQYDFDSNSFIVTSTKPILDQVAEIIRLVDVPANQVFIDVKFVTTGHTDLLNAGVHWTKGVEVSATGGSMVTRLPFTLSGHTELDKLSVSGQGPTPADVTSALGGKSPYTFGVIDFSNIAPVLEFLQTDTDSQILQAPQLTVIDNKSATVFIGDEIHFAEQFSASAQNGGTTEGIREASQNSPVKVGTQLLVMPHIVPDSDNVILSVIPSSSQLSGTSSPTVVGFERFSIGSSSIDLPRLTSRTVVTTMLLEDGQTAVLGGLINQSTAKNRDKLPFFGDIPILGWLFKHNQISGNINNLYVFISVRIIRNNQHDMKSLFEEYSVAGANVKPYKPGMAVPDLTDPALQAPAKTAPATSAAPVQAPASATASPSTATAPTAGAPATPAAATAANTPATPAQSPDVVGSGWEETKDGVTKFDVKK